MLSVNETEKSIFNRGNNVHMQMDKKSMAGRLGTAKSLQTVDVEEVVENIITSRSNGDVKW